MPDRECRHGNGCLGDDYMYFCNFLIAPVSLLYPSLKRVLNFVLRDVHIMEIVPGNPSLALLDCRVTASLSMKDWNNPHMLFIVIVK